MKPRTDLDTGGDVLFLAGTKAPAGLYRRIDGQREVTLETEDYLPASLDGHIACYARVQLWAHREQKMGELRDQQNKEFFR